MKQEGWKTHPGPLVCHHWWWQWWCTAEVEWVCYCCQGRTSVSLLLLCNQRVLGRRHITMHNVLVSRFLFRYIPRFVSLVFQQKFKSTQIIVWFSSHCLVYNIYSFVFLQIKSASCFLPLAVPSWLWMVTLVSWLKSPLTSWTQATKEPTASLTI